MQVDTWGKSLRLLSCKPTYDSSKLQRFLFVSLNLMMRKVFDSKLHNLSRAIQFSLAQLCKPDLFSSFLILSFPMSSPTGNQIRSLKVVFQSRIVASMFQCFIIFILRFSWQNMLCCYVHCWLRWLVKALRDPFVWLQQRPYERSFLSQGFDLMVAGNVPSNVPKVISRYFRCWDLKIRVRYEFARWGPRNGEFEHLLAVLRYDTG